MAQQNEPLVQPEELDMPDDEVLYELADLFRVFGDSTRIKILYALHDNELCVQDIASAVQLSQSAVSHQLRVLKDSKLVRFRRERKLRPEDGGRCQHRCRCGKGDCQLHDPEDEGGVCRGCRPPRHHGECAVRLQEGGGRLRDL